MDHAADGGFRVAAAAEFHDEVGNRRRFACAPVARRIGHQAFGTVLLNHISGALRCALRNRIQCHTSPKARFEYRADSVLFDVVD